MLPLLLSLSLIPSSLAASAGNGEASTAKRGDGIVRFGVTALTRSPSTGKMKRQVSGTVVNYNSQYVMNINIGTPPQNTTVGIDTGSIELWVNPTCENGDDVNWCKSNSQFDYTKSSSLQDKSGAGFLSYGKGNTSFDWVADTITIGSTQIQNQIFGVTYKSYDMIAGILGLGVPFVDLGHPTFVENMAQQGAIKSRAYSIDLRSASDPSGSIIFGGIDTGKFTGSFAKMHMLDPSETPDKTDRMYIKMTGIGITTPDGVARVSDPMDVPVFLDSGGSVTRVSRSIFEAFAQLVPGKVEALGGQDYLVVDCSLAKQPGTLDFSFGDKVIRASYDNMVMKDGSRCILGILPKADDRETVLGDSFLRAAFVTWDLENRDIHIAQAANCGEHLVAIDSGKDAVPSVTGDCPEPSLPTATVTSTLTFDIPATTNNEDQAPGPTSTLSGGLSIDKPSVCTSCGKSSATASASASPSPTGGKNDAGSVSVNVGAFAVGFLVNLAAWLA